METDFSAKIELLPVCECCNKILNENETDLCIKCEEEQFYNQYVDNPAYDNPDQLHYI
jgi:hypothetical protein